MRIVWVMAALVACTGDSDSAGTDTQTGTGTDTQTGTGLLGDGTHDVTGLVQVIGSAADGLDKPQDLEFNPLRPNELWVVSQRDDSVVIFDNPGEADQASEHIVDPYAMHFMEEVTSIAFGADEAYTMSNLFGTCGDSTNTYNDTAPPNYFMGPSLWSGERDIFGQSNQAAIEALGFDLGSHVDMLHESPNCMGIEWDHDNVYWVFDGYHQSIYTYDFREDHGVGYDDHSDGIIERWVEGKVQRSEGTPSHLALDHSTGLLYISYTGNNKIKVLDTNSGQRGAALPKMEPGTQHYLWDDADIRVLVNGEDYGMLKPAGMALVGGQLLVTDGGTGRIHVFDLDGNELDWAETGRVKLAGVWAATLSDIWLVDQQQDELLRIQK